MKKVLFFCMIVLATTACKDKEPSKGDDMAITKTAEPPVPDGQKRYAGDFYFQASDSVAVLTARDAIYAVAFDDMTVQLNDAAQALKKDAYDMVRVVIYGTEAPNPYKLKNGEGWDKMITIKKIIEIAPADNNQVITTGASAPIK